ncbi:BCCT family transporter [Haloglycomyces albus]|uniref:BCCT family transporter n=1 Tax=Haloglycomyces albus TaxID=526067 RepID=UPI00046D20F3|nr:BCCT family transporter [Haloglycomyces albus]
MSDPESDSPTKAPTATVKPASRRPATLPVDKVVFSIAAVVILGIVGWGAFAPDNFDSAAATALQWVLDNFAWFFILAANVFLILAVYIAASRYGNIRLGNADEDPEFGTLPWISMMFAAGMGIGLMFFGVSEPLTHYFNVPSPLELDPFSPSYENEQERGSLVYSYFHWALHPWAIYAITGLALGYSTFRKRRGNNLSEVFTPLLDGKPFQKTTGRAIDLLAIFATVFGTAASLGLGAAQVTVGLDVVMGVNDSEYLELIVIGSLTLAFVVSAFSGVHRGVKWLSTTNVLLAAFVMLFVFFFGPTQFILDALPESAGQYLQNLVGMSFTTGAFGESGWVGGYTIFYWAWWLSWAPFVGTFIARISRGRTVRQFVIGVLLIPSMGSITWFSVMGGSALWMQVQEKFDFEATNAKGEEYALFALLDNLPAYSLIAGVCMLLIAIYFVTGADSASLVLGSLSSNGSLTPKKPLVVFWGFTIGALAAVLLLSGGLNGLKNATIVVALPFVVVMLFMCVALLKELRTDPGAHPLRRQLRSLGFREAIRRMVGEEMEDQSNQSDSAKWSRGKFRMGLGNRRSNKSEE